MKGTDGNVTSMKDRMAKIQLMSEGLANRRKSQQAADQEGSAPAIQSQQHSGDKQQDAPHTRDRNKIFKVKRAPVLADMITERQLEELAGYYDPKGSWSEVVSVCAMGEPHCRGFLTFFGAESHDYL